MNHRVDTNVEWHAFFTSGKGTFRGVARYCGTGKIREWGPLLSSISGKIKVRIRSENLHGTICEHPPKCIPPPCLETHDIIVAKKTADSMF